MENDVDEVVTYLKQKVIKERKKAKKIGYILWIVTIAIGIFGCIFWKWYALLISFGIALIFGSIYSYYIGKKVQKEV